MNQKDPKKETRSVPKHQMASIYQGLHRLVRLVRKMQFYMTKTDRRIYGDKAEELALQCTVDFCIAFDFQDERPHQPCLV